ncbi:unnamed protein product, partial [Laminaria digitata]
RGKLSAIAEVPGGSRRFAEMPKGPLLQSLQDCGAGANSLRGATAAIRTLRGRVSMHGPRWGGGAGGSKQPMFDNGRESSASQAGLSQGTLGSCVVSTGRSAVVPPVSVFLLVQGGSGRGAVIPR